jgi:hypothetical protein
VIYGGEFFLEMAVEEYEEHGERNLQLDGVRLLRRLEGLDSLTQEWQTEDRFSFQPGGVMPDHPGMTIVEVETEEDGPLYLHRLTGEGVVGSKPEKRIRWATRQSAEGWDGARAVWITRTPGASKFNLGAAADGFSNLYVMEVEKEELRHGYHEVSLDYQGLVTSKPYARRVTVNEQIVSSESMVVSLDPEWEGAQKGEASLGKIVVMDAEVTAVEPNTAQIPGNEVPPDAPSIQVISVTGVNLTRHWPNGWKLASIDYEKVPGKSLWLVVWTYEYVWVYTP